MEEYFLGENFSSNRDILPRNESIFHEIKNYYFSFMNGKVAGFHYATTDNKNCYKIYMIYERYFDRFARLDLE